MGKRDSEMLKHKELSLAREIAPENMLPQQLPEVNGISFVAQYCTSYGDRWRFL